MAKYGQSGSPMLIGEVQFYVVNYVEAQGEHKCNIDCKVADKTHLMSACRLLKEKAMEAASKAQRPGRMNKDVKDVA